MQLTERIKQLIDAISYQVYEKETIFRLAMLALLGEESIFLLGKPGIAKSLISRRMKFAIKNGSNFEYLMSKFSTPEEIYGPIDLRHLKEGKYIRVIEGYLPSANIGFLDEIWKAGPSIQNTLLTIINEKIFRNGGKDIKVPLKLLISASNELPAEGEGLEALFDRFIIRFIAEGLKDEKNFDQLLDGDSSLDVDIDPELQISIEELEAWKKQSRSVKMSRRCLDFIHYFRKKMQLDTNGEAYISDRRWKKIAGLIKTSAFYNGRAETDIPDLFVIPYCIWDDEEQEKEYTKIFYKAFLEQFGLEWRNEKRNLLNQLDSMNAQIGQVEAQYLRLTPYDSPFRGQLKGTYYLINFTDGGSNYQTCFISAADWNKINNLPSEAFDIDLHFGPNINKYGGTQTTKVKAYKSDQILFVKENKKYLIQNDNPGEFNNQMVSVAKQVEEIEQKVKEVSAKMFKEYKKYTKMNCVFFEDIYNEKIAEAFDTVTKKKATISQPEVDAPIEYDAPVDQNFDQPVMMGQAAQPVDDYDSPENGPGAIDLPDFLG
ncbi:two-component regulator system yien regulator component protein [Spiroplasma helicoides]|uniref:Two-component regulator system yien regulator component protein n=1 Tax=Spiroplasma helicoides TaxID=216938 RepID=A0A1B3SK82_9MOLU|nr:AAA family ATPase [Spiroplasma helicoides]AOG60339.1 two-component regulator system yien regulator component protein [Spiroplasma helicoides]